MSKIDQELARAAHGEPDAPPVVSGPKREAPPKKGNLGLLVVLLVMGLGITGLVLSFKEAAVYAKTVEQVVAEKDKLAGRAVRVEGDLVKGSLVHQEQPCEYRFRMSQGSAEIPVRYANCVVPDTFRDVPGMDVKVTVEGKLSAAGQFEASLVMAKCPSKYEMKQRSDKGEKMPHADVRQ
jgi:cytochrome c-type biogenesis protein CcmE